MATLNNIFTGMSQGPEAINTNFNTLGQFGNLKCVEMSTVSTMLNGISKDGDWPCSFEVVDPINRVARISFEITLGWPSGHEDIPLYINKDAFQFNSSLFKSLVPNAPLIGSRTFNGWGDTHLSSYINDHTVGFKAHGTLKTAGGAYIAGSFLAYY